MKNCYERRLLLLGPWSIASFAPAPFLWQLPVYGSRPPHLPSRPGVLPLAATGRQITPPHLPSRPGAVPLAVPGLRIAAPHLPSSNALLVQFGFTNICHCTTYRLRRLIENYHLGYVVLRQFDAQLERKMTACHKCDTLS